MSQMANTENLRPEGELSGLLWDVCAAVRQRGDKKSPFSYATFDTLDIFSTIAPKDGLFSKNCERMKKIMVAGAKADISDEEGEEFKRVYKETKEHAMPVSTEFLMRLHELSGLTSDHSLTSMDHKRLMTMEADAYADQDLKSLLKDISSRLKQIKSHQPWKLTHRLMSVIVRPLFIRFSRISFLIQRKYLRTQGSRDLPQIFVVS